MSSKPMYKVVAEALINEINRGTYAPGAKLPGHVVLARQHNVSLITSNRALVELERAGMVERRPRQGTFVCDRIRSMLIPLSVAYQSEYTQVVEYLEGIMTRAAELDIQPKIEVFESAVFHSPENILATGCKGVLQLGDPGPLYPYSTIRASNLPQVAVGVPEALSDQRCVNEDRSTGARMLTELLQREGCTRIGLVADMSRVNHTICRDGYLAAFPQAYELDLVRDADLKRIIPVVRTLASNVDALIITGAMGIHALNYLRSTGHGDVKVGLFSEAAETMTFVDEAYIVHLDHAAVGRAAVDLLVDSIRTPHGTPKQKLLEPRILEPTKS